MTIFGHKLSRSAPKCRDGILELIHANYEAVYFLVLPHESEWVATDSLLGGLFTVVVGSLPLGRSGESHSLINIAVELDSRLNTPVPIILLHNLLIVKESRVKSAHV